MNIYISNISYQTTEAHLRQAFETFGQVSSVSIIKDRNSGQPKGLGFIEMPTQAEALAAIKGLNCRKLAGRSIRVYEDSQHEAIGNTILGNRYRKVY